MTIQKGKVNNTIGTKKFKRSKLSKIHYRIIKSFLKVADSLNHADVKNKMVRKKKIHIQGKNSNKYTIFAIYSTAKKLKLVTKVLKQTFKQIESLGLNDEIREKYFMKKIVGIFVGSKDKKQVHIASLTRYITRLLKRYAKNPRDFRIYKRISILKKWVDDVIDMALDVKASSVDEAFDIRNER